MDYVLKQTITSNDYSKDNSMQAYSKITNYQEKYFACIVNLKEYDSSPRDD